MGALSRIEDAAKSLRNVDTRVENAQLDLASYEVRADSIYVLDRGTMPTPFYTVYGASKRF